MSLIQPNTFPGTSSSLKSNGPNFSGYYRLNVNSKNAEPLADAIAHKAAPLDILIDVYHRESLTKKLNLPAWMTFPDKMVVATGKWDIALEKVNEIEGAAADGLKQALIGSWAIPLMKSEKIPKWIRYAGLTTGMLVVGALASTFIVPLKMAWIGLKIVVAIPLIPRILEKLRTSGSQRETDGEKVLQMLQNPKHPYVFDIKTGKVTVRVQETKTRKSPTQKKRTP